MNRQGAAKLPEQSETASTPPQSEEFQVKRRELDLRELELRSKLANEKRNLMFTSPLLIAAISAVFGLAGTGVGAAVQGY